MSGRGGRSTATGLDGTSWHASLPGDPLGSSDTRDDPGRLLEVITSTAEQGILVHDGTTILSANHRLCELLDLPPEIGRPGATTDGFIEFAVGRGDYDAATALDVAERIRRCEAYSTERRVPGGRVLRIDSRHRDGLAVVTYTDITEARRREWELQRSRETVEFLASKDSLTGLANRRTFDSALRQALYERRRRDRQSAPTLLLIDLDRFKAINDRYGHASGDEVLRVLAGRFAARVGDRGLVARLGGDEFAVLFPAVARATALETADDLRRLACEPVPFEGVVLQCGASIGVAVACASNDTPDKLLHAADVALYSVKYSGRNGTAMSTEQMTAQSAARLQLAADLMRATERDQLVLHYQPQINLKSGAVIGYEALIRWQHPERGLLAPADFIPLAEETGTIVKIGRWVLRRATADMARLGGRPRLSVNVSAVQLMRSDLVTDVADALALSRFPPSRLVLEITERALVEQDEHVVGVLSALCSLGVSLSLDNVGSERSLFAHLSRFPFSRLKIARGFIDGMLTDPRASAVVASILSLAGELGLSVSAEGVETSSQLHALSRGRCEEAQGFFLGHPQPLELLRLDTAAEEEVRSAPAIAAGEVVLP